ncbi:type II toxin-antitoxin system VapC family toxin [Candidatus Viridilinea mediisalina]|uniref:Ribonuclease VapC n=1 Tax=Candidatus Viridilinea mediisalina TaxID=2024553 RepID=A0A2A6RIM5_9CHLR|nr:type II toxin-antitoxin system VapC family toxin [Candidatus Viridilinea mediisalina]PDW02746.1 VapC toxin family PIN domain ribonuclease [Candidatus Viridilinea mediisalina]
MKYLLDTNVLSELVSKAPNQAVIEWLDALEPHAVYLSVISIGEIRKGIEKLPASKRREQVMAWLEHDLLFRFQGNIVELTLEVMLTWGALVGRLEANGTPLPAIDSLIAALALHGDFVLVTRNDEDFKHTGVTIVNPWKLA